MALGLRFGVWGVGCRVYGLGIQFLEIRNWDLSLWIEVVGSWVFD